MAITLDELRDRAAPLLPGVLGVELVEGASGELRARLDIRREHLAPNGYLHAASVIGLADTACGCGCLLSLPDGATGFTTIELKANFLATALEGSLECLARTVHDGRTTQVWDATVTREDGRTVALFRCTQLLLYD